MMAYKCDGCDSATKLAKLKRSFTGAEANHTGYIKYVRTLKTDVRTATGGGSVRPLTGQILPRGT